MKLSDAVKLLIEKRYELISSISDEEEKKLVHYGYSIAIEDFVNLILGDRSYKIKL